MHAVHTTPTFDRQAGEAGLSVDDVSEMAAYLAKNPLAGDPMVGTSGARKVRFARKGSGKSSGYRTIHFYGGDDVPLFLLALIDKGDRANLSKAERNALAKLLSQVADAYRSGVTHRVTQLRRKP